MPIPMPGVGTGSQCETPQVPAAASGTQACGTFPEGTLMVDQQETLDKARRSHPLLALTASRSSTSARAANIVMTRP